MKVKPFIVGIFYFFIAKDFTAEITDETIGTANAKPNAIRSCLVFNATVVV